MNYIILILFIQIIFSQNTKNEQNEVTCFLMEKSFILNEENTIMKINGKGKMCDCDNPIHFNEFEEIADKVKIYSREELLRIKNGYYRNNDGSVNIEFYNLLNTLDSRVEAALKTTMLPSKLDKDKVNELVLTIYKKGLF